MTPFSIAEQVAAHLREEILRRQWSGMIPGRVELAAEPGMSITTVEVPLQLLEKEGLLVGLGAGRWRRIVVPEGHAPPALRVLLLVFDSPARGADYMIEIVEGWTMGPSVGS